MMNLFYVNMAVTGSHILDDYISSVRAKIVQALCLRKRLALMFTTCNRGTEFCTGEG
jgi:hypothetical protein